MPLPKKILLLHGAFSLGGIETHILRLAEELHGRGIEVQVLLLTQKHDARLLAELRQYAVVHFAADMLKNPASPLRNNLQCMAVMPPREAELKQLLAGVDCVHVCGVWSLVYYIRHVLPRAPRTKVVCGVYHQNEFNFRSIHPRFFQQLLFQLVDQSIPAGSMLFFNEKSIDTAVELYGEKYTGSDVFPIGIKFRQDAINPSQNVQSRKIISVGRITSFKTYNFKMVAAFPEILKIDPAFEYHIYGDGEQLPELRQFIEARGLQQSVILHGSLPYQDFEKVIGEAFAFVGSGTALLEAAAMGVPAIIGIESDEEGLTYGLLSQLKGYSYHEKGLAFPLESFATCIAALATGGQEAYAAVSARCKMRAAEFSIGEFVDLYIRYLNQHALLPDPQVRINMPKYLIGIISCFVLGHLDKKKLFSARY